MAYDEGLAERLREALHEHPGMIEKKMFGGLCFMLNGHMCCGIVKDTLMLRVGPEQYEDALAQPHARKMDFTGRAMKGMVYVDPAGFTEDEALKSWVQRGLDFVHSLPPK